MQLISNTWKTWDGYTQYREVATYASSIALTDGKLNAQIEVNRIVETAGID